jgi:hydroxyethylthiazole kinase
MGYSLQPMSICAFDLLDRVRRQKPLVHHLTNWVTIYDCAQVVKSLGAAPVMAHAPEEAADMAGLASSVVLNIGTLTKEIVESMKIAAAAANSRSTPVLLDVCGAGATALRDRKCQELLDQTRIDIIKGNASEIARIAGADVRTRGVDTGEVKEDLATIARRLASARSAVVVATGPQDLITDGRRVFRVDNGHPLMAQVVGTGCMAASVIGTFAAIETDLAAAAASALVCYGIAGEVAAPQAEGPVSFKQRLLDRLFQLDRQTVVSRQRLVEDRL